MAQALEPDELAPWVARAKAGDRVALEHVLAKVAPSVYRFGLRMCGNAHDADDVLQDTLVQVSEHLSQFEGRSALTSWVFTLARTACSRRRRGLKNRPAEGYRLRPGACWAGYDGWTWGHNGVCGNCRQHTEYRCHDGYKLIGGGWYPKICRKVIECDGRDPDAPVYHDPVGAVTSISIVGPGRVRLRGWVIDPDATRSPVTVGVYRDGVLVARPVANRRTTAIPPFYWASGLDHGFDVTLTGVRPGEHMFRVFASNIGEGRNTKLGEKRLRVPYPANQGTG